MRVRTRMLLFAAVLGWIVVTPAGYPGLSAEQDLFKEWEPVNNKELSDIRGGYTGENGMEFSFGLSKMVLINGVPLVANTLNLNLGGAYEHAVALDAAARDLMAQVQAGTGNSIDPTVLAGQKGAVTFIQNSLDRALIQNSTRMDATITVRGLFRDINLSSLLSQQLINARH